ncbi:hypothetical protein F5884DRAFT_869282 [Xylogone sp. PMI_703]|nr:hypothetical protein F5884DRAFT_869282 [Xylogone sp. PMI_703]
MTTYCSILNLRPTALARKSTAYKLAKQLRKFHGCTHEQHHEADQAHQAHHQRHDVHSECSSIPEITSLLRGTYAGGTPLPDVLSNPKFMKATDLREADCQAAFEGVILPASPRDNQTPDDRLPRNLCLSTYYTASKKNRRPKIAHDIDSMCCFPKSLGVARNGINWYPKFHAVLNLTADIHFG